MKKTNHICIFDTETIPDVDALRAVYGYEGDDASVMQQAFEVQKNKTGSEFLPINFHKVVAISAVMADEFGKFERVNSIKATSEGELINKFISFINSQNPRLISFNGRGFDMPMLMVRAMKYNLSCPTYFDTSGDGKDKWTNYRSRYDGVFHLDLCDHIGDFGAARGIGLDAICKSVNIPGKYDTHGDDVFRLYLQDEIEKIEEYCESDTLNTYWLFLKYELLRGNITGLDYANHLLVMSEWLDENKPEQGYTEVFCIAIDNELERINLSQTRQNNQQIKVKLEQEAISPISKDELNSKLDKLGVQKGVTNLKSKPKNPQNQPQELQEIETYDLELPEIDLDSE
ncbi:3'-5' exonuclease [Campylobacter sp. 19-13652]|uniref:3'-5' exonuclease n=1 Tax=Campylobacter sp. 19-13652 TaxID=2840180 RepID=UPI001C74557E|nr:3'-5' exonuclease [Campylobacter sp. 19-13652]BCX79626.1 polysaccharide biosynthesis protein [Campylobacter sp. 19-13652]